MRGGFRRTGWRAVGHSGGMTRSGFIVMATLLLGCGSSSHSSGSDASVRDARVSVDGAGTRDARPRDETNDPDVFYEAFAEAACDRQRECEVISGSEDTYCHPEYRGPVWTYVLAAWRSGRAVVDPEAVRACLDAIAMAACDYSLEVVPPEACLTMLSGTVPDGGACTLGTVGPLSYECEPGLTCISEGACPGRCAAPSAEGEPCSPARQCVWGLQCEDGACVRPAGLGEACASIGACAHPYGCIDGVCSEGRSLGEACGPGAHCRPPLSCQVDAGSGELRCIEWFGTAEGDRCNFRVAPCDYPLICAPNTGSDGTCMVGQPLGGVCSTSSPCAPGGRCADGLCREIVSPESACDTMRVCPLTHECVGEACVPRPTVGDACTDRCFLARCEAGACLQYEPEAGEACNASLWHCAPGFHCTDVGGELVCSEPCG